MVLGILSDIHGNAAALQKVLAEVEKNNAEKLLILGDCVGYYYEPAEVFELLSNWQCEFIKGNHENILLNYVSGDKIYRENIKAKYGSGFDYCMKLEENVMDFINKIPETLAVTIDGLNILLAHGSPENTDEYIYPDVSLEQLKLFKAKSFDYIFLGHTHYPMFTVLGNAKVINPGSVGQSRVTGGIANWGILNTANGVYRPMATKYETTRLIEQVKKKDPALPYLHEVLVRNN